MIVDAQAEVIAFLSEAANYPHAEAVERLDTHTASVFLAADRAYKLKRAVRYDYLDYSSIEKRAAFCQAEVRLNRRTAPGLYLGAVPLTRTTDGRLELDGEGPAVDWLVVMQRFPQEQLFDRRAEAGQLSLDTAVDLADRIAEFHNAVEIRRNFGGAHAMGAVLEGNWRACAEAGAALDQQVVVRVDRAMRERLAITADLLDRRRTTGMVRQCHGDLHLRNIVMLEGEPTLFDAVEFNDEFACIDVMYDLAFLLMDLLARELPVHATSVLNRYMLRTGDFDGLGALPLFLSTRAAIRAKTSLSAAAMGVADQPVAGLQERARRYLNLAARLITPVPAQLVAIGGYSGTGKSTLARRLAPGFGNPPGAVVLRTDEIRRQIFAPRMDQQLPDWAYTPTASQVVYAELCRQAKRAMAAGYSVIADGVFADLEDRRAIEMAAGRLGVPFTGLWLDARPEVLERRIRERRGDVSEATVPVLHQQLTVSPRQLRWAVVDAGGTANDTERHAHRVLPPLDTSAPHGSPAERTAQVSVG